MTFTREIINKNYYIIGEVAKLYKISTKINQNGIIKELLNNE